MLKKIGILISAVILFNACGTGDETKKEEALKGDSTKAVVIGGDCKMLYLDAARMDSILLKELEVKNEVANKAIKAFTDFAFYCAADSLCPIYLIKSAQVAQSINNIPQAKVVLDKCIDQYPKSTHYPAALFLLAQLFDEPTYLNNEVEAKRIYEKIINEFPKSDWAKSSKGALNFIGKSDAQIMEQLKKKK